MATYGGQLDGAMDTHIHNPASVMAVVLKTCRLVILYYYYGKHSLGVREITSAPVYDPYVQ